MADASLAREVDLWVQQNRGALSDDAIRGLRCMGPEDQRRVINAGPLQLSKDIVSVLRARIAYGREREQQLAERKGVEAARFAKPASDHEAQQWLEANRKYMDDGAIREFTSLRPEDKWRVISEGGLRECVDAAYVVEQRAVKTKELSSQVAALFAARREQNETAKPSAPDIKVAPSVAAAMQDVYASFVGREVPAHMRRCGGFQNVEPEPERDPLVGNVKGVGGVIEILKQKYGCNKGQRLRVLAEQGGPAGTWRLEDAKTVPKTHFKEGGWRWVLESEEAAKQASPRSPDAASPPPASPPAAPPGAAKEAEERRRSAKREASKSRSGSSSSSSSAKRRRARRSSKSKSKAKGASKARSRSRSASGSEPPRKKAAEKSRKAASKSRTKASQSRGRKKRARSASASSPAPSPVASPSPSSSGQRRKRSAGGKRKR